MKNFSTWMLVMFMIMFWLFRLVVAVMPEFGIDFGGIIPLNKTIEVILLFVVLLCMILIVKRKTIGAIIYLLSYGMYFGVDLINNINLLIQSETLTITQSLNTFISLIGMIIPLAVFLDILLDKGRKANPKDKKTDWFYKNEKFDRELDERADKNNYRTL